MKKIKLGCILTVLSLMLSFGIVPTCPLAGIGNDSTVITVEAVSIGKQNALKQAKSYLSCMAFSKKGLIEQLKFEGYTTAQAKYAVNHCKVSWKKQAVKKAKSYLKSSAFSKSGLLDQLKYEGFTTVQAKYGVKKAYK